MSGHSKWSTIKRKKGVNDAKRSKLFSKIIREITIACKESGPNPDTNSRLRLAIQNAKGSNMPKDTIERAIKKGAGVDSARYIETTYEGYAVNGVAVIVECTTDNLNRTLSNIKSAFNNYGGSLGKNGSLEHIFERKGVFELPVSEAINEEEFTFAMLDSGAENVEFDNGYITVTCAMEAFGNLQKKLEVLNLEPENAGLQRIPNTTVKSDDGAFLKIMKFIDALEDDDDVQKVYHNIEIEDRQMELI
ncbi:MAG: YebC/PmpR family DNA-binding transcriptional regulator [Cytophagales bacterium]|nr:YebC/PmpR family DNA-binding transcriptional regulator [Cytophagales bacterium]